MYATTTRTAARSYPATYKQIEFIKSLGRRSAEAQGLADGAIGDRHLTSMAASNLIDALIRLRQVAEVAANADPVTEVGMYRTADGSIFKVQLSKESKRLYAKQLTKIGGERLTDDEEVVNFEFQYAPGAVQALHAADRMTLDEARAFGIQYGICCVCGAWLSDATSVANGIGPVCAKRV